MRVDVRRVLRTQDPKGPAQLVSEDMIEGITAFAEKRAPEWKNRYNTGLPRVAHRLRDLVTATWRWARSSRARR